MTFTIIQDVVFCVVLVVLAWLLGRHIATVMDGGHTLLSGVLQPVEKFIYRLMGIDPDRDMSSRRYAFSVVAFSLVGLVVVFGLQMLQAWLPGNPQHLGAPRWDLSFNTAVSYITNTNWQAYAGETTLSYLTQALGLTVQNFTSAATGIAVLFVVIRGFIRRESAGVGNFWADLVRVTLYILLPLSLIVAILLMSQGVVQTLIGAQAATTLQDGSTQWIPLGPAASQIAIKQLGTNGGGFFGANSAFPLENPTAFANLVEMMALLIIPVALCFTFGRAVKKAAQGRTVLIVMGLLFVIALVVITCSEQFLGPDFAGVVAGGNMEGKEVVNGVGSTALWGASTTSASNGAVNGMFDSFTALGGMMLMFLMQLGEIVFGGVGSGLYGMIAFVMLTVFIAGLMVGRTPEYLGKKIEPYDMKMVCLVILAPPLLTLLGTAAAVMMPGASGWVGNSGAHGFSEILYAFTSMGNNNGSAFAGFDGNTYFTNLVGGVVMLGARFIPMLAVIFMAGHIGAQKPVAAGEGTLSTTNGLFIGMLTVIIVIIGALSFLPALALGPIADFVTGR